MKRNFTKILAAFALLVFTMPSLVAWGQTRDEVTSTYIFTSKSWTATLNGSQANWTSGKDGGGFANNGIQVTTTYSGANGTSPISFQNVTRIVATYNTNKSAGAGTIVAKIGDNTEVSKEWAYSGSGDGRTANYTVQWDYATAQTGSVKITCNTTTNSIYLVSVAITTSSGGTPTVAAPTFSPDNGTTFEETLQVTLSQADSKAIYYNINSESDPDASSTLYTAPISISATSTIKAIAIDGENTSSVATATYTKLVYNNIEDIVANQTQYTVKGTVVATNNRGFVIGDGTGYVYTYLNSLPSQLIGDLVRISGSTGSYGHVLQFTSSATITTSTTSNYDHTPAIVTVDETAIGDYNSDYQLSDYVQYEGTLTKSTSNNNTYYNIAVGSATARISYQTTAQANQLEALLNKTVKVKGYFAGFSSNIFTTMMESVEEVVNTDPTIIATPNTLTGFTYVVNYGPSAAQSITVSGSNLTDNIVLSLGESSNFEMSLTQDGEYSNTLSVTPTEGTVEATTIYVRMKTGFAVGSSYTGIIAVSSDGANSVNVSLSGSVTEPEPENFTWDLTTNSYSSASADLVTWSSEFATMTNAKGNSTTGANNYLGGNGHDHTRFYKDNVLTITPATGYAISKIEITAVSGNVAGFTGNQWTNATTSTNSTLVTVLPTNGNSACSVVISAACRATQVKVYYAASTATLYSITIDNTIENGSIVADREEAIADALVTLTILPAAGYYLEENNIMVDVTGVEVTKVNDATYTFTMPANDVTVSAVFSEYTGTYYTLVTSEDQLVAGRHYIIASSKTGGAAYAMGAQNSTYRDQVEAVVVGTMIYETEGVSEIVLNQAASNLWVLYDEEKPGYLYASSVSNNNLGTRAFNNANNPERGQWAISFSDGVVNIVSQIEGENAPNTIRYNAGSSRFSCYPGTQDPVYLYLKANETNYTYVKDINAYEGDGGYVLVASPVSTTPTNAGMTTTESNYDLYYFDNSQEKEWINYKNEDGTVNSSFGNLTPGTGYLYANSANVTLTFAGTAYTGTGAVPVVAGYNLVGNPYAVAANLNVPYYRLNASGSELSATTETSSVNVMEGVFINAEQSGMVTFSTSTSGSKGENIALNVMKGRGTVIDRAIVRFDGGDQLPKFQLFENSTKLYIAQGNEDYAVVRSAAQGEMPVSFRASENGTYTIAVEAENVDMNYLHLIDNMTGADVDLLATPNYTFEARTNDYTSRFRLVFSANGIDDQTAETFAYFNGTNWTVSNTGDATLQVVDITGRIVSSETINGNATVSINQPAGIYMLRLVNGNDVKVQKVVVR